MFEETKDVWSVKELQQAHPAVEAPTRPFKSDIAERVTARAQQDGYNVSLYAVRQWAAQGQLRVTQAGRKKLINYQSLLDHLEGTTGTTEKAWN